MRCERQLSQTELAQARFQEIRTDLELRRLSSLMRDKRIHLDPVIYRAKFDSMAQDMFTAFQQGGLAYCIKFVDKLAEFSQSVIPYIICCDDKITQYVPSLLVSIVLHPPNNESLFSVLRCLASITSYSTSKKFSKVEFVQELFNQILNPVQCDPSIINPRNLQGQPTSTKIRKYCLTIIINLLKNDELSLESFFQFDFVPPLQASIKSESAPEAMKLIHKIIALEEIDQELLEMSFNAFMLYVSSTDPAYQIASFDGISVLARWHPDFFVDHEVSEPIIQAYNKIKSIDDTVVIAALALIGSLLATRNELIIKSIFSLFDWGLLSEIWNISSHDQKQIICEFVNTALIAAPDQINHAFNSGIFHTLLENFSSTDYILKAETLVPIISATDINPSKMLPMILENDLVKAAASMLEVTDENFVQIGLRLISTILRAEYSNAEQQESIRREISDSSIESDLEYLATGSTFSDVAAEISDGLLHFMESSA